MVLLPPGRHPVPGQPSPSHSISLVVVAEVERPGWRAHSARLADCLSLSSASTLLLLQTDDWSGSLPLPVPHPRPSSAPLPLAKQGSFFFRERLQVHLTHAKTPEGGDPVFRDLRFFRAEGKITSVIIRGRGLFFCEMQAAAVSSRPILQH